MDQKNQVVLSKEEYDAITNKLASYEIAFKQIIEKVNELERRIDGIGEERHENNGVYTDEELYVLKQQLSWKNLELRTGIKQSTLQYRLRRYARGSI